MKRLKRSTTIYLIILGSIVILTLGYKYQQRSTPSDLSAPGKSYRKILYYNSFFDMKDFQFGFGTEPFIRYNCPVTNCWATGDKTALGSVANFDAILFHIYELNNFFVSIPSQKERKPNQRYVMFQMESPLNDNDFVYSNWNGFFNWTMTYRSDSDIPRPYGWVEPKAEPFNYAADAVKHYWKNVTNEHAHKKYREILQKKNKSVAWIVSHCQTSSRRESYVKELQKYIQVDIMGKCGMIPCNASFRDPNSKENNINNCTEAVDREYKFYLAFENSLCKDYVTEKFFNRLSLNTLPIVFGGADYSKLAPPHSYINTNDFKSPKDLAEYIHHLNNNDSEYLDYFWWKEFYNAREDVNQLAKAMCHLCAKLNDPDEPSRVYDDLEKWWRNDADCPNKNKSWYSIFKGLLQKKIQS